MHGSYPFSQWTINEIVADRYGLRAPVDAPAGAYSLEVAIGQGEPFEVGAIEIQQSDRILTEPKVEHPVEAALGDSIELVGYNIDQAGESSRLTLVWRALQSIDADYTVFTHVLDPLGKQIGGQDNQPVNDTYPTSRWAAGEYVIDPYVLKDLAKVFEPSQGYTIEVGLYDPETGARLGSTVRLK